VESEQVNTAFFKVGESKIELLESMDPAGVIAKFIEKRGEGLHHTAYDVTNIEAEMSRLKEAGFVLLNETPKKGADNKWVCFVHPKHTNGVLIELCQEIR
jgi:methylmalonyl-CoA/ethylmalonyl-CoA epimerase